MHDPMLFMHTPVMIFMLFMRTSLHTPIHTPTHDPIIIAISTANFNLKNVEVKEKIDKNLNFKNN